MAARWRASRVTSHLRRPPCKTCHLGPPDRASCDQRDRPPRSVPFVDPSLCRANAIEICGDGIWRGGHSLLRSTHSHHAHRQITASRCTTAVTPGTELRSGQEPDSSEGRGKKEVKTPAQLRRRRLPRRGSGRGWLLPLAVYFRDDVRFVLLR